MAVRALDLTTTREGQVERRSHQLTEEEVQVILNSFTPSALLGLDVRSKSMIVLLLIVLLLLMMMIVNDDVVDDVVDDDDVVVDDVVVDDVVVVDDDDDDQ